MKTKKDSPDDDCFRDYFTTDSEGKLHLRIDKHSRGIWLGAFEKYIAKLNELYKTEADAKEELFRRINAIRPFRCTKCNGHEFHREYGETVGHCKACNTQVWFFAQTEFFAGIKRAKARLFMILLMENGLIFNTKQFAEALKIAYSTAWNLNSKAKQALLDVLSTCAEIETVDSAFFRQVFIRRSIATAANQHPVSEQELMESEMKRKTEATNKNDDSCDKKTHKEDTEADAKENANQGYENSKKGGAENSKKGSGLPLASGNSFELLMPLSEIQTTVYEAIRTEPITIETLLRILNLAPSELTAALTILELNGLIESLPGSRYVRYQTRENEVEDIENNTLSEGTILIIESAIGFIQRLFHGVSRKYVQLYLAYFWLIRNRGIEDHHSDSFFTACYEAGDTGVASIQSFVSPLKLQVSTAEIAQIS
ncbi:MAG: hypothetical protein KGS72_12915 [Cyanobacteria bacterium REEB67]|nr:hypothetical protein [Cyanobacteria bacterium REEB67]